jgi:hypothetical protein
VGKWNLLIYKWIFAIFSFSPFKHQTFFKFFLLASTDYWCTPVLKKKNHFSESLEHVRSRQRAGTWSRAAHGQSHGVLGHSVDCSRYVLFIIRFTTYKWHNYLIWYPFYFVFIVACYMMSQIKLYLICIYFNFYNILLLPHIEYKFSRENNLISRI